MPTVSVLITSNLCSENTNSNIILARERCIELLSEDPEREALRLNLEKDQRKLAQAQQWLREYEIQDNSSANTIMGGTMESLIESEWGDI